MVRLEVDRRSPLVAREDLPVGDGDPPAWFQPIKIWRPPQGTIALIMDRNFPADDATRLVGGVVEARPSALWVVRETDRRARDILQTLLSQGTRTEEPVLAPLVAYWKWPPKPEAFDPVLEAYDNRARIRDEEISRTCELVLVARDRRSDACNWWVERSKLFHHIKIATR